MNRNKFLSLIGSSAAFLFSFSTAQTNTQTPEEEIAAIAKLEKVFEEFYHLKFALPYTDPVKDADNRKKIIAEFTAIFEKPEPIEASKIGKNLVNIYSYFGKNLNIPEIMGIHDNVAANNNGVNDKQSDGYTFYITTPEREAIAKKYQELASTTENQQFEANAKKIPGRLKGAEDFEARFDGQNQDLKAKPAGEPIDFNNAFSQKLMTMLTPLPMSDEAWKKELELFNERIGTYKLKRQFENLPKLINQKPLIVFIQNTQNILNVSLKNKIKFPANDPNFQKLFIEAFIEESWTSKLEVFAENFDKIEAYLKSKIQQTDKEKTFYGLLAELIKNYTIE